MNSTDLLNSLLLKRERNRLLAGQRVDCRVGKQPTEGICDAIARWVTLRSRFQLLIKSSVLFSTIGNEVESYLNCTDGHAC